MCAEIGYPLTPQALPGFPYRRNDGGSLFACKPLRGFALHGELEYGAQNSRACESCREALCLKALPLRRAVPETPDELCHQSLHFGGEQRL